MISNSDFNIAVDVKANMRRVRISENPKEVYMSEEHALVQVFLGSHEPAVAIGRRPLRSPGLGCPAVFLCTAPQRKGLQRPLL